MARLLGIGILALASIACNRYELQQQTCPEFSEPRSALGWQLQSGSGVVQGQAVTIDSLKPVRAQVALFTMTRPGSEAPRRALKGVVADDGGRFRMDSVAPGAYELRVRQIGFVAALGTIELRPDSGVQVVAALAAHSMMMDGCGYAYVQVRKPWWKLW